MRILDTLKWLWDPRDAGEKAYDAWNTKTPLQRHMQTVFIYIKGQDTPFKRGLVYEDISLGSLGNYRVDIDDKVTTWLGRRGTKGVKIDNVWYAPDQIERIEIGEKTVESIE